MACKDQLQEKPWAVLGWTMEQWRCSKMWKRAGVSEEEMAKLVFVFNHKTVEKLKDDFAEENIRRRNGKLTTQD